MENILEVFGVDGKIASGEMDLEAVVRFCLSRKTGDTKSANVNGFQLDFMVFNEDDPICYLTDESVDRLPFAENCRDILWEFDKVATELLTEKYTKKFSTLTLEDFHEMENNVGDENVPYYSSIIFWFAYQKAEKLYLETPIDKFDEYLESAEKALAFLQNMARGIRKFPSVSDIEIYRFYEKAVAKFPSIQNEFYDPLLDGLARIRAKHGEVK